MRRDDVLTYTVVDGQELEINCRTEDTFPPSATVGYRIGDGTTTITPH